MFVLRTCSSLSIWYIYSTHSAVCIRDVLKGLLFEEKTTSLHDIILQQAQSTGCRAVPEGGCISGISPRSRVSDSRSDEVVSDSLVPSITDSRGILMVIRCNSLFEAAGWKYVRVSDDEWGGVWSLRWWALLKNFFPGREFYLSSCFGDDVVRISTSGEGAGE